MVVGFGGRVDWWAHKPNQVQIDAADGKLQGPFFMNKKAVAIHNGVRETSGDAKKQMCKYCT